ncbi:MAG: universal stress protein [Ardenticatenaceae bacterium]|nr:universal stress protein [Ardenticatenaceae bacterium]HBY98617.1 universal stress protein [Chloroflexota bacterium]
MFTHLLVPLDGSRLAEAVLPVTVGLARSLAAAVTLLHVIERDAPATVHGEPHLTDPAQALAYLEQVGAGLRAQGLTVTTHVHEVAEGNVARSIVEHAEEFGPDLIVLSTHGAGGLRGLLFGRIAQQVLSLQTTPVLIVAPNSAEPPPTFACRRILVPLDADPRHEVALDVAAGLARACGATLSLIHVVPTRETLSGEEAATGMLMPRAMSAVLDLSEAGAAAYLQAHREALEAQGLHVETVVYRGEPAAVLAGLADSVDLVVLATHARKGLDAFWQGSVAPRLLSRSHCPLLFVRAADEPSA